MSLSEDLKAIEGCVQCWVLGTALGLLQYSSAPIRPCPVLGGAKRATWSSRCVFETYRAGLLLREAALLAMKKKYTRGLFLY